MSRDGEYLSLKEVGALLGLSDATIRRRLKDGTLPAAKIGGVWRVRRADLDRLFPAPSRRRRPAQPK